MHAINLFMNFDRSSSFITKTKVKYMYSSPPTVVPSASAFEGKNEGTGTHQVDPRNLVRGHQSCLDIRDKNFKKLKN